MLTYTFRKQYLTGNLKGLVVESTFTGDACFRAEYMAEVGTIRRSIEGGTYKVLAVYAK